jgi:hypothetical protein
MFATRSTFDVEILVNHEYSKHENTENTMASINSSIYKLKTPFALSQTLIHG